MKVGWVLVLGALGVATITACGEDTVTCGNLECDSGQLCVKQQAWTTEYRCVDNPCEGEGIDCECAAPACGPHAFTCVRAEDREVDCACETC